MRFPQSFMSHHRRLWFLLPSRKSQPQSSEAHLFSRRSLLEVRRSAADRATPQATLSRLDALFSGSSLYESPSFSKTNLLRASDKTSLNSAISTLDRSVLSIEAKRIRSRASLNLIALRCASSAVLGDLNAMPKILSYWSWVIKLDFRPHSRSSVYPGKWSWVSFLPLQETVLTKSRLGSPVVSIKFTNVAILTYNRYFAGYKFIYDYVRALNNRHCAFDDHNNRENEGLRK